MIALPPSLSEPSQSMLAYLRDYRHGKLITCKFSSYDYERGEIIRDNYAVYKEGKFVSQGAYKDMNRVFNSLPNGHEKMIIAVEDNFKQVLEMVKANYGPECLEKILDKLFR